MRNSIFSYVRGAICILCLFVGYSFGTTCQRISTVDIVDNGSKCEAHPDCVAVKHNETVSWRNKSSATLDYKIDFKSGSPVSETNIHADGHTHTITKTCTNIHGCPYSYSITRANQQQSCQDPVVQIIPDGHFISPPQRQ